MPRTLTHEEVAALAESVGLPGEAFAQIAKGESGYQVGAVGHDPGGTTGLGLWQITTKYNDDIIAKYGGRQKLLTDPLANARAAKAIYDRQGIKAWYGTKYLTDPKAHYKGTVTAPHGVGTASASSVTPNTPTAPAPAGAVDPAAARREALQRYVLAQGTPDQPDSLLGLAGGLKAANQAPPPPDARTALTTRRQAPPAPTKPTTPTTPSGTATFEGKTVAAWIKPALVYGRAHGWKGTVNSGFRSLEDQTRIYNSGVRPAAKPGTSNHEGADFPRGAVDVSEAQQLSNILRNSPYGEKLQWAGAKDPVHFSHPHNGSY